MRRASVDDCTFMGSKREISPFAKWSDLQGGVLKLCSQMRFGWRKACGIHGLGRHVPRQGQDQEEIRTGHELYALTHGRQRLFGL